MLKILPLKIVGTMEKTKTFSLLGMQLHSLVAQRAEEKKKTEKIYKNVPVGHGKIAHFRQKD